MQTKGSGEYMKKLILFLMIQLLLKLERPFYKFGKLYGKIKPIENPKAVKLTVRVDNDTVKILDDYCLRNNISRADGVREGIRALKDK